MTTEQSARINQLIKEAHLFQQTLENVPPTHRTPDWVVDYLDVLNYITELNRTRNALVDKYIAQQQLVQPRFTVIKGGIV